jgi:transposase
MGKDRKVVIDPPTACECCGGNRLRKLSEDVTRTLESSPRRWKVIETVREKFSCRDCQKISQAPAPFHAVARGWAGPSLLAMIIFEKFGQHQPLDPSGRAVRSGRGADCALDHGRRGGIGLRGARSSLRLVEAHVMAAERLHGDDTTVPVLARGKTYTGRCWIYVRDDRPLAERGRRRRCSITPTTARANIPRPTWPDTSVSCRRMPVTGITSSIWLGVLPDRSGRRPVGRTAGTRSSPWPRTPHVNKVHHVTTIARVAETARRRQRLATRRRQRNGNRGRRHLGLWRRRRRHLGVHRLRH